MTVPTSSAGGQAPESGQPQAGTPTAPAAIPAPGAQPLAPQAGAGQAQPRFQFNSPEEVEAFAQRLIADRQEANRKEREVKGELKTLQEQMQWLVTERQLDRQRAIAAQVQLAAKTAGFRNPAFVYGAIVNQLHYDQATGQPTNVQAILDALKASDAYLLDAPPAQGQPPQAQPGQPAQGQPGQLPQGVPPGQPAPQQQGLGVMNAPRSQTTPAGASGLTWEVINANIRNPTWVAANMAALEAFQADPANHQGRK